VGSASTTYDGGNDGALEFTNNLPFTGTSLEVSRYTAGYPNGYITFCGIEALSNTIQGVKLCSEGVSASVLPSYETAEMCDTG
jgi:hypothetical protein